MISQNMKKITCGYILYVKPLVVGMFFFVIFVVFRCYGRGWLAKPYAALAGLHDGARAGPEVDKEVLALQVKNTRFVL